VKIFDPHVHMTSRTTDDYEAMAAAGVTAIIEPAFWLGQPRTNVGSFIDYFSGLVGWERFRASQFGIRHHCAIALNPKEANDPGLQDDVLAVVERYLPKDGVVAVGEVGYDAMTPAEDKAFEAQLALAQAHELPVLVHTPHRDKLAGTKRSIDVVRSSGIAPERVVLDHNNELTVEPALDSGCWVAFSVYPDTKMDVDRMVRIAQTYGIERLLVNSAADWGRSDPLRVRKVADAMLDAGIGAQTVQTLVWDNPVACFGQSGRLELDPVQSAESTFEGNSIQRGAPAGSPA
jgi:predicted metal-dependent TIM-barrel fold hydrolase